MRRVMEAGRLPMLSIAAVLALVLSGCAASQLPAALTGTAPAAPSTAPSRTSTPEFTAGVGDEVVLIDCELAVPIRAAAEVLGVSAAEVMAQLSPPESETPYAGVVAAAMSREAVGASGRQHCRYVLATAEEGGPEVVVTVLPNGAAEFDRIEPDVNDGLNNMVASPLGDRAFSACRDGEWQGCRAEVLTGTTWLSITVSTPEADPATFLDYAGGVVDSLGALTFAQPEMPERPDCDVLLGPDDLSDPGALVEATGGDRLTLDDRASQTLAAQVRGGLVDCAWSGTDATAAASGSEPAFAGVALTVLPGGASVWGYRPPAALPSTLALQPVDLTAQAGATWPASGVEALAGCADDQCQVTLAAGEVWLTVTSTGSAGLAGTRALAATAYTRYAATR